MNASIKSMDWAATQSELRAIARSLGRDVVDPEDLLSEAIERLLSLWSRGQGPSDGVPGYLVSSMKNRVIDECRSPRSLTVHLPDHYDSPSTMGDPEREAELLELRLALNDALEGLSEINRILFLGSCLHGQKLSELAAAQGISENAACLRISRAKKELKKQLQSDPRMAA